MIDEENLDPRDAALAWKMATKVEFLTPSERETYAAAVYHAMQWGKNVK